MVLLWRLLGGSIQGPKGLCSDPTCGSGFGRTSMAASWFGSATSSALVHKKHIVWDSIFANRSLMYGKRDSFIRQASSFDLWFFLLGVLCLGWGLRRVLLVNLSCYPTYPSSKGSYWLDSSSWVDCDSSCSAVNGIVIVWSSFPGFRTFFLVFGFHWIHYSKWRNPRGRIRSLKAWGNKISDAIDLAVGVRALGD